MQHLMIIIIIINNNNNNNNNNNIILTWYPVPLRQALLGSLPRRAHPHPCHVTDQHVMYQLVSHCQHGQSVVRAVLDSLCEAEVVRL